MTIPSLGGVSVNRATVFGTNDTSLADIMFHLTCNGNISAMASVFPNEESVAELLEDINASTKYTEEQKDRFCASLLNYIQMLNRLALVAAHINIRNGFWDDRFKFLENNKNDDFACRTFLQAMIALATTEDSETVEATREKELNAGSVSKDSIASEQAGHLIRSMDFTHTLSIPLAPAFFSELKRNISRGHKHGRAC